MNLIERLAAEIFSDEEYGRQMRFVAGPRQCGKTTMIRNFLEKKSCGKFYYAWDRKKIKEKYKSNSNFFLVDIIKYRPAGKPWICFDEIHKTKNWKNLLKEIFDEHEHEIQFIISGSARLDLFRRSGDSLAGRYFLFHLFPLNFKEALGQTGLLAPQKDAKQWVQDQIKFELDRNRARILKHLLKFSGFPEPFIKGSEKFLMQWQKAYTEKIIYEDLRDISQIKDLDKVSELLQILPEHVGSPLSINALSKRLEINFATTKNYLKYLELAYLVFHIRPYGKNLERTFKKEFKTYFFDWTRNKDESKLFENYIAVELFTLCNYWVDAGCTENIELYFIRNTDNKKETDFLIVRNRQPWLLIEAKLQEEKIASHHYRHSELLGNIPLVQINRYGKEVNIMSKNTFVVPAGCFFA